MTTIDASISKKLHALEKKCKHLENKRRRAEEKLHLTEYNYKKQIEFLQIQLNRINRENNRDEIVVAPIENNHTFFVDDNESDTESYTENSETITDNDLIQVYEAKILKMQNEIDEMSMLSKKEVDVESLDRLILLDGHAKEMASVNSKLNQVEKIAIDLSAAVDMLDIHSRAHELHSVIEIAKTVSKKLVDEFESN